MAMFVEMDDFQGLVYAGAGVGGSFGQSPCRIHHFNEGWLWYDLRVYAIRGRWQGTTSTWWSSWAVVGPQWANTGPLLRLAGCVECQGAMFSSQDPTIIVTPLCIVNSLKPSDAYMLRQPSTSLVQITAWRLYSAKPLSRPVLKYCQLDPCEQTSMNF